MHMLATYKIWLEWVQTQMPAETEMEINVQGAVQ